jgi:hypothetical protein
MRPNGSNPAWGMDVCLHPWLPLVLTKRNLRVLMNLLFSLSVSACVGLFVPEALKNFIMKPVWAPPITVHIDLLNYGAEETYL